MQTPYAAVITNKVSGEKLTVEVRGHGYPAGTFNVTVKGCTEANTFYDHEWTITPIVKVPAGLGAVVEHKDGLKLVRADDKSWWSGHGFWCNEQIAATLRDGGRILSEGVKDA